MREKYNKAVTAYRKAFEKKQDLEFEYWQCDEVGGLAYFIGDYCIDFRDIKFDIDEDIKPLKILEWYDIATELFWKDEPVMNYKTFNMINK